MTRPASRIGIARRRFPWRVTGMLGAWGATLAARGLAQTTPSSPLPAESPVGGPFWTWIVPIVLFLVALAATVALYRHFSRVDSDTNGRDGKRNRDV